MFAALRGLIGKKRVMPDESNRLNAEIDELRHELEGAKEAHERYRKWWKQDRDSLRGQKICLEREKEKAQGWHDQCLSNEEKYNTIIRRRILCYRKFIHATRAANNAEMQVIKEKHREAMLISEEKYAAVVADNIILADKVKELEGKQNDNR